MIIKSNLKKISSDLINENYPINHYCILLHHSVSFFFVNYSNRY